MAEEQRYWDAEIETMPLAKLRKIQEERLQLLVARAYEKTTLYRRKFEEAGIKPADIKTLDDLKKLPLIEYLEDFCNTPVADKLAVPLDEVKEISSTSGTVSGFTQPCLKTQHEGELSYDALARMRWTIGARPWDIVQLLGGPPEGYKRLGAAVMMFWAGRGNLDYQIRLAKVMNVTILEQLPSLALRYLERAKEIGINIRETKLRLVTGAGEPLATTIRKKVEFEHGVSLRMMYGSSETGFIAGECEHQEGMHILSDHYIVEVIDPQTKELLNPGEEGEIVVTPLLGETMPLIRYRIGDVGSLLPYKPCPCGRTHPKISLVKGRVAHIIRLQSKKILPIDIEEVLASISELGNEYQIIVPRQGESERLKVKVEVKPTAEELERLKHQTEEALYQRLGIDTEVELVSLGDIGRTLFKAQRLILS